MSKKLCIDCGKPIPTGRLKALPGTETCVACSQVAPVVEASWGRGFSALAYDDSPVKEPSPRIIVDFR